MSTCGECGSSRMNESVLPEYEMDLGGVTVRLINSVIERTCPDCEDQSVEIEDLNELIKAAALARSMIPVRLSGKEVKFLRTALEMNGKQFAKAMELKPETVSRWENNDRGIGGYTEKLLRHNICSLLYKKVRGFKYDPEEITNMRFIDGDLLNPITFKRIVALDHNRNDDSQSGDEVSVWRKQTQAA